MLAHLAENPNLQTTSAARRNFVQRVWDAIKNFLRERFGANIPYTDRDVADIISRARGAVSRADIDAAEQELRTGKDNPRPRYAIKDRGDKGDRATDNGVGSVDKQRHLSEDEDKVNHEISRRLQKGIYVPDRVDAGTRARARKADSGGTIETAAEIARRSHLTDATSQTPEFVSEPTDAKRKEKYFAINKVVKPLEEAALRSWAERNGLMLDNDEFERKWRKWEKNREEGESSEHDVYFDPETQRWFKRNDLSHHAWAATAA